VCGTQNLFDISWIGSINLFLGVSLGLVSGTLYDRGYLYVRPPRALSALDTNSRSYHLLFGGSLLQSFALFMLSLTKPGQYYEVRHPSADALFEPPAEPE